MPIHPNAEDFKCPQELRLIRLEAVVNEVKDFTFQVADSAKKIEVAIAGDESMGHRGLAKRVADTEDEHLCLKKKVVEFITSQDKKETVISAISRTKIAVWSLLGLSLWEGLKFIVPLLLGLVHHVK